MRARARAHACTHAHTRVRVKNEGGCSVPRTLRGLLAAAIRGKRPLTASREPEELRRVGGGRAGDTRLHRELLEAEPEGDSIVLCRWPRLGPTQGH